MSLKEHDLDSEGGHAAFLAELDEISHRRLMTARERQLKAGIIREDGALVSEALPGDMQPGSKTTLDDL